MELRTAQNSKCRLVRLTSKIVTAEGNVLSVRCSMSQSAWHLTAATLNWPGHLDRCFSPSLPLPYCRARLGSARQLALRHQPVITASLFLWGALGVPDFRCLHLLPHPAQLPMAGCSGFPLPTLVALVALSAPPPPAPGLLRGPSLDAATPYWPMGHTPLWGGVVRLLKLATIKSAKKT